MTPSQINWPRIGVALTFVYFAFRLTCFALWFHPFVPPDEVDLFRRVELFCTTAGVPRDTPETADLGVVRYAPFAYFWLMARAMSVDPLGLPPLLLARMINVSLALATAILVYRLSRWFLPSPGQRILALFALTNTLQFSTLSATVTYDNLATALTLACLVQLFALREEFRSARLLAFAILLSANALTKVSQLPLVALLVLALAIVRRGHWRENLSTLGRDLRNGGIRRIALALVASAVTAGCVGFYGFNLICFGTLFPTPLQVHAPADAVKNRIFRRDWAVDRFREGSLTFDEAVVELERIPNGGNRRRGLQMLRVAASPDVADRKHVSIPGYLLAWTRIMGDRILGFQGNGSYVVAPSDVLRAVSYLFLLGAVAGWILTATHDDTRGSFRIASLIVFGYSAFLILAITYPLYRRYGILDNTVNGRYLFPVLPLVYFFVVRYAFAILPSRMRPWAGAAVAGVFLVGDLPHLLPRMGPCWFADASPELECPY